MLIQSPLGRMGKFEIAEYSGFLSESLLVNVVDSLKFLATRFRGLPATSAFLMTTDQVRAPGGWKLESRPAARSPRQRHNDRCRYRPAACSTPAVRCWSFETGGLGGFDGPRLSQMKRPLFTACPRGFDGVVQSVCLRCPDNPNAAYAPMQTDLRENLQNAGDTLQKDFTFRKGHTVSGKVTTDGGRRSARCLRFAFGA